MLKKFKKTMLVLLSVALGLSAFFYQGMRTVAAGVSQEIRILEITDSGTSDLASILGTATNPQIKIDSIRMKQFVALRDELDGKYDAIYIGKGLYNSTLVGTDQNHNTTSIMNDITNLKMKQIKDFYIDRGLPVIVYSQKNSSGSTGNGALYQTKEGILKAGFQIYADMTVANSSPYVPGSKTNNVIFVGNNDLATASAFLTKSKLVSLAAGRPRLIITEKPIDYTTTPSKQYVAGDTLTYKFDVANVSDISQRSLVVNLYMGIDSVLKYGTDQLLISNQAVTNLTNNTLSFVLPKGYSGVHYWKLEIVDQGSTQKDIQTGVLRFHDEVTNINVLQVLPTSGSSSSLNVSSNMNPSYLTSPDYKITIKTMSITDFNKTGYQNLNGLYDMIIFGFADSYNSSAPIDKTPADAVNAYIATGQSVMFTHDTVFQGSSNWISYFQQATGQVDPKTNMGLNAPQTSKTTKKVNEGLLTRFPFNISSSTPVVNTTHDQYFGLKLEDENLIPWYNITGGTRDNDDSWNHYYTYSYGNVTYSGTGHTNTNFPDWEQQLFVNTMYRAFIGSNHKPTLTVDSPTATKIIPSYSDVLVSYTAQDFDLIDRELLTSVSFDYREKPTDPWKTLLVKDYKKDFSGKTINEYYSNPLPNGGDLKVTVSAKDKSGALVSKTVQTAVVKVNANIDLSRTLSDNVVDSQIEKNIPFTMTYTLTPKKIPYRDGINVEDLVIKDFNLNETLPANMDLNLSDVSPILKNPKRTGSLQTGYQLKAQLENIPYKKEGNFFVADPISFTMKVTPKNNGNYLVNTSQLNFNDFYINGSNVTKDIALSLQFPSLAIQAITKITRISLTDMTIAKGDTSKFIPIILPEDATNKALTWSSDRPDVVTVDSSGNIKGITEGKAKITATATDGSGVAAVATVTVIIPGLNITGPSTVNVDDTINLDAVLVTLNEKIQSVQWSLASGQDRNADLSSETNSLKSSLTGVNTGTVNVTATVVTDKKTWEKTFAVTVLQPIQLSLPPEIRISKGEEWKYDLWPNLTVTPASSKTGIQSFTSWSSSSNAVVSTNPNSSIITGKAIGVATITASYRKNIKSDPVTASTKVVVMDLQVPSTITIAPGDKYSTSPTVLPEIISDEVKSNLIWSEDSANGTLHLGTKGQIIADKEGIEQVKVSYTYNGHEVYAKTIEVRVVSMDADESISVTQGQIIINSQFMSHIHVNPSAIDSEIKSTSTLSLPSSSDGILSLNTTTGDITGNKVGVGTVRVSYNTPDRPKPITRDVEVEVLPDLGTSGSITRSYKYEGIINLKSLLPASIDPTVADSLSWTILTGNDRAKVTSSGDVTMLSTGTVKVEAKYQRTSTSPPATRIFEVRIVSLGFTGNLILEPNKSYDLKKEKDKNTGKEIFNVFPKYPDPLNSEVLDHLSWSSDHKGSGSITVNSNTGVVNTGAKSDRENITVTYTPSDGSPVIRATVQIDVTGGNKTKPDRAGDRY